MLENQDGQLESNLGNQTLSTMPLPLSDRYCEELQIQAQKLRSLTNNTLLYILTNSLPYIPLWKGNRVSEELQPQRRKCP